MNRIKRRRFWFHKFEFFYYRILKHFLKIERPTDFFKHRYIGGKEATNNLFGNSFYFNPTTDIGNQLFFSGSFESQEINICRQLIKENHVVYDIGANIGYHSVHFANWAVKGSVHCFEPAESTRKQLEKNTKPYSNIKIHGVALSDENGTTTFYVAEDNAYSGLKDTKQKRIVDQISVPVNKLDTYINNNYLDPPDFIKIDVEGLELSALRGMTETLTKAGPSLFVEVSKKSEQNSEPNVAIEFLRTLGYTCKYIKNNTLVETQVFVATSHNYFFTKDSTNL